jgi:hypothetical protein
LPFGEKVMKNHCAYCMASSAWCGTGERSRAFVRRNALITAKPGCAPRLASARAGRTSILPCPHIRSHGCHTSNNSRGFNRRLMACERAHRNLRQQIGGIEIRSVPSHGRELVLSDRGLRRPGIRPHCYEKPEI